MPGPTRILCSNSFVHVSSRRLSRPNGPTAAPVREHSVRGDISLPAEGLKIEGQRLSAAVYERLKKQRARCTAAGGHYVHNGAYAPGPPFKIRELVHICAYPADSARFWDPAAQLKHTSAPIRSILPPKSATKHQTGTIPLRGHVSTGPLVDRIHSLTVST